MPVIGLALKNIIFGWVGKMATAQFIEWLLLWGAEQYVKSTETKADDEFYNKFKALIEEGK